MESCSRRGRKRQNGDQREGSEGGPRDRPGEEGRDAGRDRRARHEEGDQRERDGHTAARLLRLPQPVLDAVLDQERLEVLAEVLIHARRADRIRDAVHRRI
jgi:hypothetical protein